jgi:hypothetical protein
LDYEKNEMSDSDDSTMGKQKPPAETKGTISTCVATFEIHHTQVLDQNAEVKGSLPEFARDPANLISLYRAMVLTRLFDKKAVALQRTGQLGTYSPALGQEATFVAVGSAMRPEDVLLPTYRESGAMFLHGVSCTGVATSAGWITPLRVRTFLSVYPLPRTYRRRPALPWP